MIGCQRPSVERMAHSHDTAAQWMLLPSGPASHGCQKMRGCSCRDLSQWWRSGLRSLPSPTSCANSRSLPRWSWRSSPPLPSPTCCTCGTTTGRCSQMQSSTWQLPGSPYLAMATPGRQCFGSHDLADLCCSLYIAECLLQTEVKWNRSQRLHSSIDVAVAESALHAIAQASGRVASICRAHEHCSYWHLHTF